MTTVAPPSPATDSPPPSTSTEPVQTAQTVMDNADPHLSEKQSTADGQSIEPPPPPAGSSHTRLNFVAMGLPDAEKDSAIPLAQSPEPSQPASDLAATEPSSSSAVVEAASQPPEGAPIDEKMGSSGPAEPQATTSEPIPQTPQVSLCFLMVSGKRRAMSFEPETTVGRVKELVWNAWPTEWQDDRPPAPSYLRILYLGKILQDEDTLKKLSFAIHTPPSASSTTAAPSPAPTIVHLSIRPYAPNSDDDALVKKRRRRTGTSSSEANAPDGDGNGAGCCGCVVA